MQMSKHTINLKKGDYAKLSELYKETGIPVSQIIRHLITNHIAEKEAGMIDEDLFLEDIVL